jgi:TIR domain
MTCSSPIPTPAASEYARALQQQLANLDFESFLDEEELPYGEALNSSLSRAIRRSRVLVLVGTRGALTAHYVNLEVSAALGLRRAVVNLWRAGASLPRRPGSRSWRITSARTCGGRFFVVLDEQLRPHWPRLNRLRSAAQCFRQRLHEFANGPRTLPVLPDPVRADERKPESSHTYWRSLARYPLSMFVNA